MKKEILGAVVLGLLIGMIFGSWYFGSEVEMISPLSSPQPTATPTSDPTKDPLTYIRWKGQQEGYDDYTISGFIQLARSESYFHLDPYAKNPTSTAKGIFQFVDGTWRQYCLEDGNVYDFVDNINCFYKVLKVDGYPNGLRHWGLNDV